MPGPLQGIKVLDLSRVLAGPWATQLLADYGAEVIKVERPGQGDETRQWGPPFLKDQQGRDTGESAYFLSANRGKRSITVDLSKPAGQALIRQLAKRSDVLVENFRVGTVAKFGLGYPELHALHAGLIYCSISAFGQDGPDRLSPGYDAMIQGRGGLMSVTGVPDGEAGAGPQRAGVAVVDLMTGLYAVTAILAALLHRDKTGQGQYIDLALLDTQVAGLANQAMNYLVAGKAPGRLGTGHPNIVPYQVFLASDGFLMIAVGNDRQFADFANILGEAGWAEDERFSTNTNRVKHRDVLVPLIQQRLSVEKKGVWLERLAAAGIPCGPVNTIAEVFSDPQVRHRKMKIELPHPIAGAVALVKNPVNFSVTPNEHHLPPPLLGEHTDYILKNWLGLATEEIESLREQHVI